MLAIILILIGFICGGVVLLFTGIPIVLLNIFRMLPFDRRLWWSLAGILAYFIAKDMVLSSYDYKIPTARPDNFYFDAHLLGTKVGVITTFFLGLTILFFVGKPKEERKPKLAWMIPTTSLVVIFGVAMAAQVAQPTEAKRAKLVDAQNRLITAFKAGDATTLRDCIANGTRLDGNVQELGNVSLMNYAIQQQQVEVVRLLLDPPRGERENVRARWFRSVLQTGNDQLVQVFLESPDREKYIGRMLRAAIAINDKGYFDKAIELGASPNASESFDTPLTLCAKFGRIDFARRLLALGANPDKHHHNPDLNRGTTPLVTAADYGHAEMVELLLENGADVNRTQKNYRSALQAACRSGYPEIAKRLIDAGADVTHQTVTKATALHLAIEPDYWNKGVSESTKVSVVRILLEAGVDASAKYRYGTALELAERHDLQQVAQILAEARGEGV